MVLHELFESLPHLKLVLIWKVFHQTRDFETLLSALPEELERDDLKSVFDGIGYLPRMWTWDLCHRIRLSNHKKVLDLSQVVFRVSFRCAPRVVS